MSSDSPTDRPTPGQEEATPAIRLDHQGIPILQEVVNTETNIPPAPIDNPQQTLPLTGQETAGQAQQVRLRRQLEEALQQVIAEQVEQLTRQFQNELTAALQQALSDALEQLLEQSGERPETASQPDSGRTF